jgi:branched-chain amino acid transport system substrate-binding protein
VRRLVLFSLLLFVTVTRPACGQNTQGVSKTEIVLGAVLDLTGPMSGYGRQTRQGMQMRVAEINRQGGVNGRALRLVVVDSASDPERAAALAKDLADRVQVFALLGTLGGATAHAVMPVAMKRNVINFLPIASGRDLYEPPDPLKVAFIMTTTDQLRIALPFLVAKHHYTHPCTVAEEGEYADEVAAGTEGAFDSSPHSALVRVDYPRGSSDFESVIQKVRASSCDLIVIGGAIRDAVGVMTEARRAGVTADFVGTSALYSTLMHEMGGQKVDGMYAINTVSQPYPDDASKLVRDWTLDYQKRYADAPTVFAVYGWVIVDLFAKAAARAGPVLSTASFNNALESNTFPRDMFGSPEFHISSSDRLGCHKVRMSRLVDGKWVSISTLLDAPAS